MVSCLKLYNVYMGIYFDLIKFNFLRFLIYPWEIISSVLKRVIEVLFLILFWTLVAKSSNGQINTAQIISYFFISMGIRDLVMSHWGPFGGELGSQIKSGYINNYLIKPISIIPTLYARALGKSGVRVILALINLLVGIIIFPPKSITSAILFIIFFVSAWWISFAYNLFQGTLYFHLTDASGTRNILNNFIRVFSGEMVPIFLFPAAFGKIIKLTPFPSMVYGPTIALTTNTITQSIFLDIIVSVFWAFLLNILVLKFWKKSIKNYEAIGI